MGRFDALTQIEEKPQKPTPSPAALSPTPQKKTAPTIKTHKEEKKPENLKSRKPENNSPFSGLAAKPEKYSTLLEANLIKKIKIHAAEREIKDYQVIAIALTEYFEKYK